MINSYLFVISLVTSTAMVNAGSTPKAGRPFAMQYDFIDLNEIFF